MACKSQKTKIKIGLGTVILNGLKWVSIAGSALVSFL